MTRAATAIRAAAASYVFLVLSRMSLHEEWLRRPAVSSAAVPADRAPAARRHAESRLDLSQHVGARARAAVVVAVVIVVALLSRLRYILTYEGTFGSGDAHALITHALFLRIGDFRPSPQLAVAGDVFAQPPLIPALLATLAALTTLSLPAVVLTLVPALTVVALAALAMLLGRQFGWRMALGAAVLIALLPRLSFDSTEPEKAPFVVSFFILSLVCVHAAVERPRWLVPAGLFAALAMLSHTTAYLFLPVLALTYVALTGRPYTRALNRYSVGSLVFPVLALIAYFALARIFQPDHPFAAGSATTEGGGLVPPFVQTYIDATKDLARGGVADRAWRIYMHAIRQQLGTPLFVLACGGFARGCYAAVFERDRAIIPFVLWAGIITIAFGMQYPAASHGSRYPSYVTPAYVVLAVYFLASLFETVKRATVAVAIFAGIVGVIGYGYATAANPGLRDLYASHVTVAEYLDGHGLLDDGGALYMGWPSLTYNIVRDRPDYVDRLYTFGFGQRALDEFTPAFIAEHNIKYYLYDHTGVDHDHSSDVVLDELEQNMLLEKVATFRGRPGSYVTLYAIHTATDWSPSDAKQLLDSGIADPRSELLSNPALCPDEFGAFPSWDANGWVNVFPVAADEGTCGVLVRNANQYGGVRQQVPAAGLTGQRVSLIVSLRAPAEGAASSARIALYDDFSLLGQRDIALSSADDSAGVIEAFVPADATSLRVVIASGPGDEGDMLVHGAVLRVGAITRLLSQPTPTAADGG